ncbi:hypothetical protein [Gimesia aquarii]|uniref:Uncharacterized protein n=1 Tax=Gimesia aquarii TaxID=2527964 RepID=A0A517VPA8_9PLAN|nr:hypothetical protein [Gimesia aquarii]QDT94842.1 hypothetical protein V144x_02740 [Gimesia aquarii]
MSQNKSKRRVGRVIYQKLHYGELIEVTANFFNDDSFEFLSQDKWEIRAYPYKPNEQEVTYAKKLLNIVMSDSPNAHYVTHIDNIDEQNHIALPDVLKKTDKDKHKSRKKYVFRNCS